MICWIASMESLRKLDEGSILVAFAVGSIFEHLGAGGSRLELVRHALRQEDDGTPPPVCANPR